MVEKRDVAISILLTIITCGFYGIYWFIKLNDDINTLADDRVAPSGGMAFLFTLITCEIYSYFWMYKMGEKLDNISARKGMSTQHRGILYLVLHFFGLGLISYALMQDSINKSVDTAVL